MLLTPFFVVVEYFNRREEKWRTQIAVQTTTADMEFGHHVHPFPRKQRYEPAISLTRSGIPRIPPPVEAS
jgi:hypothetical protein